MSSLPLAPIKKILKDETDMRVSGEATEILREGIVSYANRISELASKFAEAGGRQTILGDDVVKAIETLKA